VNEDTTPGVARIFLDAVLRAVAASRNATRFPHDSMFQLTPTQFAALRSQFVTLKRGGRRYLPYVFTEQAVAMLSSVLQQ
jgi:hypothetical protein